jgi:hypothetical protein
MFVVYPWFFARYTAVAKYRIQSIVGNGVWQPFDGKVNFVKRARLVAFFHALEAKVVLV